VGIGAAAAEDVANLHACGDLDALECVEQVQLQAAVEVVQVNDLVEARARDEVIASSHAGRAGLTVGVPVAAEPVVTHGSQHTLRVLRIRDDQSA
jgi:hypothetical protein